MIQVVVVDDDKIIHSLIKSYLSLHDDCQLIGSFDSLQGEQLEAKLKQADLVFLDVEMPDGSAIEYLAKYDIDPDVIVITSDSKYAYWGYQIDALDFLLKPISQTRFDHALKKYKNFKKGEDYGESIMVKSGLEQVKVLLNDILWIEGASEYLKIVTVEGKILVYSNMNDMLHNLNQDFLRIHRSYIVSSKKIEKYNRKSVWIRDNEIPVSKSYSNMLKTYMDNRD